jgi:hypothetical protein
MVFKKYFLIFFWLSLLLHNRYLTYLTIAYQAALQGSHPLQSGLKRHIQGQFLAQQTKKRGIPVQRKTTRTLKTTGLYENGWIKTSMSF